MSNDLPSVIDPSKSAAPAPKRKRKTVAERRAELQAKLEKLKAKQQEEEMQEAIDNGECYDPEGAKKQAAWMRALTTHRRRFIDAGLTTEEAVTEKLESMRHELEAMVKGPQG